MPMLELETDRSRRDGSSTSSSSSSQPLRIHNPILSLFGARRSAAAFVGSSQGTRQLSQPPSTAATAKSIVPKRTTITSKPIILSQPVVLEDLDDLIQDWNSDGISDDEAEILATVGAQVQVDNNARRGVRVGGVIVKKEMVVGWSSQPTQSQLAPKKLPPIFRTPQITSLLSSSPSPQIIEYRDLSLPWPQKHFPTTSAGLAIHKKKVEDVSDWLLRVREGRSRKRVLVLKGPAGCGKTATLEALAKEGEWDVVEWGNLTGGGSNNGGGSDYDGGWKSGGGEGFASAFEDWLFRGGTWGCLDLVSTSGVRTNYPSSSSSQNPDPTRRKLLLLEDLPNLSHPGTLLSFRTAIRSYLSLPSPPSNSILPPIPPLILIVSEVSEGAGSSTNMGMSVHRMLGPQILSHPLLSEIQFRKVARTLLVKCLEDVMRKEGYGGIFGKGILEVLAEQGDLRGAIGGLEMLALGREKQVMNLGKGGGAKKSVKRKKTAPSTAVGKEMYVILTLLQPRLSTFGIFHSIGKVVYNKRYGDDPSDPYFPPPPTPPLELKGTHRYHTRAMKLDPNTILDESGVEAGLFLYGVQENYLGSFSNGGKKALEEVLEDVCFCAEALSEADLLLGGSGGGGGFPGDLAGGIARVNATWGGGSAGYNEGGEGVLRQEDIATQVVVRSMALGLPSPVKRDTFFGQNGNGSGTGRGGTQMYYPLGLRLWRVKEEIESVVEVWEGRLRDGKGLGCTSGAGAVDGGMMPVAGLTRAELVLERLPFMAKIARGNSTASAGGAAIWGGHMGNGTQQRAAKANSTLKVYQRVIRSLEQVTTFRGISVQPTTAEPEQSDEEHDGGIGGSLFGLDEDEGVGGRALMPPPAVPQKGPGSGKHGSGKEDVGLSGLGEGVGGLVLVEDDIVDDW
ncbi:Rad17 cell cycle checkpoint protein-domain-containing protein [Terfezia claveryi]|nr:Rad17 cell cycle checkpoint protein-domain-containing protein [Terfezia claveryi]